ncbi:hypothetical protein HZA44_03790, partial [Candidatus Peregrinibacteria bacterium]|nr:hypothetical protein [Candidatus Peregrinibacteria bacterium]
MKRIQVQTPAFVAQGNRLGSIALFDRLWLEPSEGRKIAIVGDGGYRIATNHTHPIYRAAHALQARMP